MAAPNHTADQVIQIERLQPFSLEHTLSCGQTFRWECEGGWWFGIVGNTAIRVRQEGRKIRFSGADPAFVTWYFSLDMDLREVLGTITRDPVIREAVHRCRGLRIVRQPAWECLASYIGATYSNIPMVRRRVALLSEAFGETQEFEERRVYGFPSPASIAEAPLEMLARCKMGYRAPYLKKTAMKVMDDPSWEERIRALPYPEARQQLQEFEGIGKKAADCVLLFAFQKYESFPVDVWIHRIMQKCYGQGSSGPLTDRGYEQIGTFAREYFGKYAGYAQEYLYCTREQDLGELRSPSPSSACRQSDLR
ncbi:MAG: 8-oxoguanine DNA glycosylase [Methanomicrobiales archaeon]|nr:8-oxoguanine DNA glycosylase [Methanomicrobiales archaeon]